MARDRPRRPERMSGQWPALALAIVVHIAFVVVLVFSLRWQNRKPEPVTVELYAAHPAVAFELWPALGQCDEVLDAICAAYLRRWG